MLTDNDGNKRLINVYALRTVMGFRSVKKYYVMNDVSIFIE